MACVHLAIKQGPNPNGYFDAGASLSADALAAELLTVAVALSLRRAVLILQLVREFLRLAEADLGLEPIVIVSRLLLHKGLLLLLEPVGLRHLGILLFHLVDLACSRCSWSSRKRIFFAIEIGLVSFSKPFDCVSVANKF